MATSRSSNDQFAMVKSLLMSDLCGSAEEMEHRQFEELATEFEKIGNLKILDEPIPIE